MKIEEHNIPDVYTLELEPHEDKRGFFMRVYDDEIFKKAGLHHDWVQENHSYSKQEGILRGLHFQHPPSAETKLLRVVEGEIFDVFVDLRADSPTYGQWDSEQLAKNDRKLLYVPRGFAHGFCTLTTDCHVLYKVDNYYAPEREGVIHWDSPELDIDWPVSDPITSEKDAAGDSLAQFDTEQGGINPSGSLEQ